MSPQLLHSQNSPTQFRVALLGAGYIADWHAKALRQIDNVSLVAVCDKSSTRAQACAAAHGIPDVYTSLDELLESRSADAVHVLLPPDHHFRAASAILDAGLHVFIEKPMCIDPADCDRLVRQAAKRGLRLGVGHNFLFATPFEQLRHHVHDGILGQIDHVAISWNRELPQAVYGPFDVWMLRQPRNIMMEIAPHSVAHLLDLVGMPEELHAFATNPLLLPTGMAFYRRWQVLGWVGPTAVELNFSFIPGFTEHAIHVRGSLGSASADMERNTCVLRRHTPRDDDFDRRAIVCAEAKSLRRQANRTLRDYVLSKLKLSKRGSPYGAGIAGPMRAFYNSQPGQLDPRIAPEAGHRVVALCHRIAESARLSPPAPSPASLPAPDSVIEEPRILVLGATGFIGQELVRQLTAAGRPVRILARSPDKLPPDLKTALVQFFPGDLADPRALDKALADIDCVVHLARAQVKTWADYQRHDIDITAQVAEACLTARIRRFIYTGTIDSYYAGAHATPITEQTPLDPRIHRRNLYAQAKAASERLLLELHRQRQLPLVIARPGIVIGRGGSPFHWGIGMWRHNAICQIWGSGNNPLPLVLVDDVASGLIATIDTPGIEGESFNFVDKPCLTANQYLDELEKAAGIRLQRLPTPIWRFFLADMLKWVAKVLVRFPERRRPSYHDWESRTQLAQFDCAQTRQRLGWQPTSDRDEIIRRGICEPVRQFILS